ncbi:MAG: uL15 family ribosomal protein [Candidatus Beckwithbacteria bacterium]|nr:uL15 family ribosomal protein [Candidatus Beckwithbacteria bacterium]
MELSKLPKIVDKSKKRVGRGYGSGSGGHTTGRGAKGDNVRGKVPLYFEGTKMRKGLIRRSPMLRGKLRFKSFSKKSLIFNLKDLNVLPKNTVVTIETLIKYNLLPKNAVGLPVKILGEGELKHRLKIDLPMSKAAAKKVAKLNA